MTAPLRASFGEAVRYWELRRIGYNLVLAAVAGAVILKTWPHFRPALGPESIRPTMVLALLANACYCAVYLVEAAVQSADSAHSWRRRRWGLWLGGTVLAMLIEVYWIVDEIYPDVPFTH